jgi:DNA-nicking Smr family endonuclease
VSEESEEPEIPEVVELPIDGTLDLHTFRPAEIKDLIPDYLAECRKRGILEVRIVHGKGTGVLQRSVHAILARQPEVIAFCLASGEAGGWGATLVRLRPAP